MNTTNEPAGIDLDNAALDNLEALARAVDDLPETTQPFVSMGGQVVIHTFSMSPEQVRAVANLYDAATPATIVALIALARRAPAPVGDERALFDNALCAVSNWVDIEVMHARSVGAGGPGMGAKCEQLENAATAAIEALAQQSTVPVVVHDAPEAPASVKGHVLREVVNSLRDTALAYHAHGSLRERLRTCLDPLLQSSAQPDRGASQPHPSQAFLHEPPHYEVRFGSGHVAPYSDIKRQPLKPSAATIPPASQPVAPETAHADYRTYDEACNLAKAIHAQHYRDDSPNWRVLPDLRGVISQISNMVAGMTRTHHVYRLTAPTTVPDHSEREAANAEVHGPKTLMTDEQAFNWAWTELKKDLGAERWNAGDEVQSWAFFKYGWDHRTQLELQRYKAPATIAAGQEAANAKDAARVTYTCKGKGGAYSLIGVAYGAGTSRDTTVNLYREVGTGVMYFRTPADFHDRMERINAAMAAVGAAGQEGGDK